MCQIYDVIESKRYMRGTKQRLILLQPNMKAGVHLRCPVHSQQHCCHETRKQGILLWTTVNGRTLIGSSHARAYAIFRIVDYFRPFQSFLHAVGNSGSSFVSSSATVRRRWWQCLRNRKTDEDQNSLRTRSVRGECGQESFQVIKACIN